MMPQNTYEYIYSNVNNMSKIQTKAPIAMPVKLFLTSCLYYKNMQIIYSHASNIDQNHAKISSTMTVTSTKFTHKFKHLQP